MAVAGGVIVVVGTSPSSSKVELEVLFMVGAAMSFSRVVVGVLLVAADAHMLSFETVSGLDTSLSRTESEAAVKVVTVEEDMGTSSLMVNLYGVGRIASAFSGTSLSFMRDERARRPPDSAMLCVSFFVAMTRCEIVVRIRLKVLWC